MKEPDEKDDVVARLPVRVRTTEYGDGDKTEARSVHCPVSKSSVSLDHCAGCPRYSAMALNPDEPLALLCHVPMEAMDARGEESVDLAQRMKQTPVREIMTTAVACVDSELDLNEVAQVFERSHVRAAPVVEDEGILIGMVSKGDLVRGHAQAEDEDFAGDHRFPPNCLGRIVDDVMTTDVVRLSESASIADAAKVFASHGVHRVPVVAVDESVVGILSVMDLIRWISKATTAIAR